MMLAGPLQTAISQRAVPARPRCGVAATSVEWRKLDSGARSIYDSWLHHRSSLGGQWVHPAIRDGRRQISLTVTYLGSPDTLIVCGCTLQSVERPGVANLLVPLRSVAALSRLPFVQTILYGEEMDPLSE